MNKYAINIITILFLCFCIIFVKAQIPIAYYNFDNSTNDISGNNNDGVPRGNIIPVRDRFSKPCGAMHFDGQSSYIEVPNSPSLESINNKFTFTVWYKFDNYSNNQWLTVLCKGSSALETNSNPQYRFQVQQSPFSISTSCGNNLPPQNGFSSISFNTEFTKCDLNFRDHPFNINQWCFYALTYNGSTVTAFMNGNKIYSYDYVGNIFPNKESLFIGIDEPGSTEFFEGSLDDLRIFDTNLSDKEILNLYNENISLNDVNELAFQNNLKFNLASNECKKKVDYLMPSINDNCNSIKVRLLEGNPSGSLFSVGNHKISYEIVENGGSVQRNTFTISVVDLIQPTFTSKQSDTTIYIVEPQTGIIYNYKEPTAIDNCEIKKITRISGNASGDLFKEGTNEIVYEAIDNSGNTARTSFKVNVIQKINKSFDQNKFKPTIQIPTLQKTDTIKVYDTIRPVLKNTDQKLIKNDSLIGRKNTIQNIINVSTRKIIVSVYDDGIVDGDTISVFYNGEVKVDRKLTTQKALDFEIEFVENQDNVLVMYAHNLGSLPPNTGLLIFYDGKKRYEVGFKSSTDINAKIIFRYANTN